MKYLILCNVNNVSVDILYFSICSRVGLTFFPFLFCSYFIYHVILLLLHIHDIITHLNIS